MKRRSLLNSFYCAFRGLKYVVVTQPNMNIHLSAALLALILGEVLNLETTEKLFVVFAIFIVLITEMVNTAVERTVDLYTKQKNTLAATAKDVAAGAVLLASINAVIVGLYIFYHPLNAYMKALWGDLSVISPQIPLTLFIIIIVIRVIVVKNKQGSLLAIDLGQVYALLVGFFSILLFELWRHLFLPVLILVLGAQLLIHMKKVKPGSVYVWVLKGLLLGVIGITFIS